MSRSRQTGRLARSAVTALLGTVTVSVFQALVLRLPIGCQLPTQPPFLAWMSPYPAITGFEWPIAAPTLPSTSIAGWVLHPRWRSR